MKLSNWVSYGFFKNCNYVGFLYLVVVFDVFDLE